MAGGIHLIDPAARRLSPRQASGIRIGRALVFAASSAVTIYWLCWLWRLV